MEPWSIDPDDRVYRQTKHTCHWNTCKEASRSVFTAIVESETFMTGVEVYEDSLRIKTVMQPLNCTFQFTSLKGKTYEYLKEICESYHWSCKVYKGPDKVRHKGPVKHPGQKKEDSPPRYEQLSLFDELQQTDTDRGSGTSRPPDIHTGGADSSGSQDEVNQGQDE